MTLIAVLSSLVAVTLWATYYFAYRTHGNKFFLAMSLAWALQAISTVLDGTRSLGQSFFDHSYVLAFSQTLQVVTSVCFFISVKVLRSRQVRFYEGLLLSILYGASVAIGTLSNLPLFIDLPSVVSGASSIIAGLFLLTLTDDSLLLLVSPGRRRDWKQKANPAKASYYRSTESEIDLKLHRLISISRLLLSASLLFYGVLLIVYPLVPTTYWQFNQLATLSIFVSAMAAKVVHVVGLYLLLLAGFGSLVRAIQSKTDFEELGAIAAGIEHDVRGTLSILFREIEILSRENRSNEKIAKRAKSMEGHLRSIRSTLEIIYVLRDKSEYYQKRMERIRLTEALDSAIKMLPNNVIFSRLVKIDRQYRAGSLVARVVRERFIQAVSNILVNAVEASQVRDSEEEPRVVVMLQEINGSAEISVRDNGPGIPKNSWPLLTQPGFTTKEGGNRGMGLFVASRLIEFNDGEIFIDSDGTSYTEVRVRLPAANLKEEGG